MARKRRTETHEIRKNPGPATAVVENRQPHVEGDGQRGQVDPDGERGGETQITNPWESGYAAGLANQPRLVRPPELEGKDRDDWNAGWDEGHDKFKANYAKGIYPGEIKIEGDI